MPDHAIAPPTTATAPGAGGGLIPVRRAHCIARNCAAHAVEMGQDPERGDTMVAEVECLGSLTVGVA